MHKNGVQVAQIMTFLRNDMLNFNSSKKEIYNEKATSRLDFLAGRSRIQALIDGLDSAQYKHR